MLTEQFREILPRVVQPAYVPTVFGQMQRDKASGTRAEYEPRLLRDHMRMRCWLDLQPMEGTRREMRVLKCPGLNPSDLHVAAQTQRLALLILWLFYDKKLARLDHAALDYVDIEEKMQKFGLSDLPRVNLDPVLERIESRLASEELIAEQGEFGWRIWSTADYKVILVRRLRWQDVSQFTSWLQNEKFRHDIDYRATQFLVGQIDGPTVRQLCQLIGAKSSDQDATLPAITIHNGNVALLEHGLATDSFDLALSEGCGLDVEASPEILLQLGPRLCFLDP